MLSRFPSRVRWPHVSLACNVFLAAFIVGMLFLPGLVPVERVSPRDTLRRAARHLSPEGRQQFQRAMEANLPQLRDAARNMTASRRAMLQTVAEPVLDGGRLRQLLAETATATRRAQETGQALFLEAVEQLSPADRAALATHLLQRLDAQSPAVEEEAARP